MKAVVPAVLLNKIELFWQKNFNNMFKTVGSISKLHVHVARDLTRKSYFGIFDFHFHFLDTANFVSPYITKGSAGNT